MSRNRNSGSDAGAAAERYLRKVPEEGRNMKISFTLQASGQDALIDFHRAFVQYDGESFGVGGDGALCINMWEQNDGSLSWVTATSGFVYKLTNPGSSDLAVIEYDGAWRAFLAQTYLPEVVRGETITARLTGGSVLETYPEPKGGFVLTSATQLVRMYGLMQAFIPYYQLHPGERDRALERAFTRLLAALQVEETMNAAWQSCSGEDGLLHGARWTVLPEDRGWSDSEANKQIRPGDGEVYIRICGEGLTRRINFVDQHEVNRCSEWLKKVAATGALD